MQLFGELITRVLDGSLTLPVSEVFPFEEPARAARASDTRAASARCSCAVRTSRRDGGPARQATRSVVRGADPSPRGGGGGSATSSGSSPSGTRARSASACPSQPTGRPSASTTGSPAVSDASTTSCTTVVEPASLRTGTVSDRTSVTGRAANSTSVSTASPADRADTTPAKRPSRPGRRRVRLPRTPGRRVRRPRSLSWTPPGRAAVRLRRPSRRTSAGRTSDRERRVGQVDAAATELERVPGVAREHSTPPWR